MRRSNVVLKKLKKLCAQKNVASFCTISELLLRIGFCLLACLHSSLFKCRKKVTFVAPCPGPLPNKLLLAGSLAWVD